MLAVTNLMLKKGDCNLNAIEACVENSPTHGVFAYGYSGETSCCGSADVFTNGRITANLIEKVLKSSRAGLLRFPGINDMDSYGFPQFKPITEALNKKFAGIFEISHEMLVINEQLLIVNVIDPVKYNQEITKKEPGAF